jgi:hypothetical protein
MIIAIFFYFEIPSILCLGNMNPHTCYGDIVSSLGYSSPFICDVSILPIIGDSRYAGSIKFNCYIMIAKNTNDVKVCLKLIGAAERQTCTSALAYNLKDVSVCEEIKKEYYSLDISELAVIREKEWCYLDIAKLNKDSKICDKITDVQLNKDCNLAIKQ